MTLEERAMQLYGEHFEGLDSMSQESIRKDCVYYAAHDMLSALKDMVTVARSDDWQNALTGRKVALNFAEDAIAKAEGRA